MLSFISVRDPRSASVPRSRPTSFAKTAFRLLPLSLAGSLLLTPLASHARITPAQQALHNAHMARLKAEGRAGAFSAQQAAHNARLDRRQAAHRARLLQFSPTTAQADVVDGAPGAQHLARLAKLQALHRALLAAGQAHMAEALAAHQARLLKLQARHQAQVAAHEAKMALRQRRAQAKLAAARQKNAGKYAKLHQQHVALESGNVVEAAYAFRGTRYVMGGTSRSGFDCSGFVRYILSNAGGVDVPRTAVEQFIHGAPIAPDAMQPGDLVFFKNTYKRGISHVGIYAGGGQFIHAANAHKGVRMDSLNEPYYIAHFAGARRVLPAQMREAAFLQQQPAQ